jgi:diguanylate cyclase (GGDEF)-like protein
MMEQNNAEKKQDARDFSAIWGSIRVVAAAMLLAEVSAFIVYSFLEPENLPRRLLVTGIISFVVAAPITYYILEQKRKLAKLSRELAFMASIDQMSGLLNRTSFIHAIKENLHTPKGAATGGSFLFVDIDNFKSLNDRFGHSVGDDAIRSVAEAIKTHCDNGNIAGRIGGEEFGLFLPKANKKSALSIAENLRRQVRKIVVRRDEKQERLSVSIGVSIHKSGQTISTFVQNADEAMYQAKEAGRNKVMFEAAPEPREKPAEEIKHRA